MQVFGLGLPELLVILVVALLVFGPRKLPELGKSVGQTIREFRKATSNASKEISGEVGELPPARSQGNTAEGAAMSQDTAPKNRESSSTP